jgi:putative intracellular protease/amidase
MKLYNSFMPMVHADFHEMGAGSSFFFPPGADPWHEAITPWQKEYSAMTGKTTAGLFDTADRLYFTKDNFDLFCPSFGDTWPLFNGAMGFTLEQGGGAQAGLSFNREERDTLTLKQRIEGHYLSTIGVLTTAYDNRERLMKEFYDYFRTGAASPPFKYKTIVIKGSNDAASLSSLKRLLEINQISFMSPKVTGKKVAAFDYRADKGGSVLLEQNDIIISAYQPQSRLIQVLFEPDSRSSDSISYDLTAWSLPYVYNIEAYAVEEKLATDDDSVEDTATATILPDTLSAYAYAASMTGFNELKFMGQLYKSGLNVRYSLKPFVIEGKSFTRGTVIVARGDNMRVSDFDTRVKSAADASSVVPVPLRSGMVSDGKDLGSEYAPVNKAPTVALAGGEGTSQAFGEIWFFMERELEFPVTIIDGADIPDNNLSEYDILILPGGDYTKAKDRIMTFLKDGGRVIAIDNAMALFRAEKTTELGKASDAKEAEEKKNVKSTIGDTALLTRYEDQRRLSATERSAGAIFRVRLDETHPYAFGMGKEWFMMKRSTGFPFLEKGRNIGYITDNKPVAGFAGYKFCQKVRNTNVVASEKIGDGEVIYLSDDPYFRAYWKSGRVLLGNLILR